MLAYWHRIAIGSMLGVLAVVFGWYFLGITWVTALVGALLAPIGFLGSYFLVSADRPDEGYEQVLFDRPNTIVAALMILIFAGLGVGTGFLGAVGGGAPADLTALATDYKSTADAYDAGTLAQPAAMEKLDEVRIALDDVPASESRDILIKAVDAERACVNADMKDCPESFNQFVEYRLKSSGTV